MKKSWLLTNGIFAFGLLPAVIVACSNNNANNLPSDSQPTNQTIVAKEIQRIEQIKIQLKLKIKNPTIEEINNLNAANILQQLDNWTEGTIENQPGAKFTYTVIDFNNGLTANSVVKALSFKIRVSYQDYQSDTSLITIQYQIEAGQPQPPTILPEQLLDPAGGTVANTSLKTSSYNNLITALNLLTESTYLPQINDQKLQAAINDKPGLEKISLKIANGSDTSKGILQLNLNSPSLMPTTIVVSGFQTYSPNHNQQLQYHNFQIDQKVWFDQQLPIETSTDTAVKINAMTNDQWNQLLSDFQVSLATGSNQNFGQASQLKRNGFAFKITRSTYDANLKQIKLVIQTSFINQKYENNQWVKDQEVVWNQASNRNSAIRLFTKDQLQQFLVDQTTINEAELANYVPSYYLGKAYYYQSISSDFSGDTSLFLNPYIDDQSKRSFIDYYFGTSANLAISFNQSSVRANDWKNTLNFRIGLFLDGQIVNGAREVAISGKNKAITTVLQGKLDENNVQIDPASTLKQRIIQHLKQRHKSAVDQLFASVNASQTFNDFDRNALQQITQLMLNYEDYPKTNQIWETTKQQVEIALFNKPGTELINAGLENNSNNTLNFASHLFQLSANDAFVIEQMQYQFENEKITIKLTKIGNIVRVELLGQTYLEFAGSDQEAQKTVPTNFFFPLLADEWNGGN